MAGSYRHCRNNDGSFRFDLIENMGDAHEACEMMYFMVNDLAKQLDQSYREVTSDVSIEILIKESEFRYYKSINPSITWETFSRNR